MQRKKENSVLVFIENSIHSENVVLFMKGTASYPQCGFSATIVNILKELKIQFRDIDVLKDINLRQGIKDFTDWPTIPQLYIKGKFVGGCDVVKEMYENGDLLRLLEEQNLIMR